MRKEEEEEREGQKEEEQGQDEEERDDEGEEVERACTAPSISFSPSDAGRLEMRRIFKGA
eukprot:983910-Pyramimonas_sp.AAC.1